MKFTPVVTVSIDGLVVGKIEDGQFWPIGEYALSSGELLQISQYIDKLEDPEGEEA